MFKAFRTLQLMLICICEINFSNGRLLSRKQNV